MTAMSVLAEDLLNRRQAEVLSKMVIFPWWI